MENDDQQKVLKEQFLIYFRELPIQKLACQFINRDEDTISRWKKEDPQFAEQVSFAKSVWMQTKAKAVDDPKWLLERVGKEFFSAKTELEVTDPQDIIKKALAIIKGDEPVSEDK